MIAHLLCRIEVYISAVSFEPRQRVIAWCQPNELPERVVLTSRDAEAQGYEVCPECVHAQDQNKPS